MKGAHARRGRRAATARILSNSPTSVALGVMVMKRNRQSIFPIINLKLALSFYELVATRRANELEKGREEPITVSNEHNYRGIVLLPH